MDPTSIDYADVQGTILRGYRVDLARHFILEVVDVAGARGLLGSLVDGTPGMPQITTAARWATKPEFFVNIGFTCPGLARLGLSAEQLATFDLAFQQGATSPTTAGRVKDVGSSAPERWIGGLADGTRVHAVLSLWVTRDRAVLDDVTARLRAAFAGRVAELSAHDARALSGSRIHFGYRDSIAQPTIAGAPPRKCPGPDGQPVVQAGEFLLGYPNESSTPGAPITYWVEPEELSRNSSYSAFRILEQDVAGFEAFLATQAAAAKIDPELLAAKVCGRWRNGNPLELRPEEPGDPLPPDQINDFHYVDADPRRDDTLGLKCPIGSHIRRNNPRDEAVVGGTDSTHHRIVRRAMPYGPAPEDGHPDAAPRGLVGHFINASIRNQFEFLMGAWNNGKDIPMSVKVPAGDGREGNPYFNISGDDVFLGENDPKTSSFTLAAVGPKGENNVHVTGFDRMITTRGGAYCFLPSISGIRYLAGLAAPAG